jgi:hypothetical protein
MKVDAAKALYWWIICTVPSVESQRHWANKLIGEDGSSAKIFVEGMAMMFCTLSRTPNGSFWLEYKGRKCLLV